MIEAEKTYENILFEQDGAVAYVTMNRPKKRNALSLEHMRELLSLFEKIGERRDASVVILRAEGPAFCSSDRFGEPRRVPQRLIVRMSAEPGGG